VFIRKNHHPVTRRERPHPAVPGLSVATLLFLLALFPGPTQAALTPLGDNQLAAVTGHGFSSFSMANNIALAELDIRGATFTEIDALKLGYYDNGGGLGWDQNWNGVQIGSNTQDLTFNGFYLRTEYSNAADPAARQLLSARIGFHDVSGTISAAFQSFSGSLAGGTQLDGNRQQPAFSEISLNHSEVYLDLQLTGPDQGIRVHFDPVTTQ